MALAPDTLPHMPPNALQVRPVPLEELQETLGAAIRAGADGRLSRGAELFMSTVCAEVLADRIALAGLVVGHPVE